MSKSDRQKRIDERNKKIQKRILALKVEVFLSEIPPEIKKRRKQTLKEAIRQNNPVKAEIMRHLLGWCASSDPIFVDGVKIRCSFLPPSRMYLNEGRAFVEQMKIRREIRESSL